MVRLERQIGVWPAWVKRVKQGESLIPLAK